MAPLSLTVMLTQTQINTIMCRSLEDSREGLELCLTQELDFIMVGLDLRFKVSLMLVIVLQNP